MVQDGQELRSLINSYKKEQKELRKLVANICWHMRGGVTREEAWALSAIERTDILELIDERVKAVEKTGLPIL